MGRRERLDRAIERRDTLKTEIERVKGRLEAARQAQAKVEADCRAKGVDPDNLETSIDKLTERYSQAITDLETRIEKAEKAMKPYVSSGENG